MPQRKVTHQRPYPRSALALAVSSRIRLPLAPPAMASTSMSVGNRRSTVHDPVRPGMDAVIVALPDCRYEKVVSADD